MCALSRGTKILEGGTFKRMIGKHGEGFVFEKISSEAECAAYPIDGGTVSLLLSPTRMPVMET